MTFPLAATDYIRVRDRALGFARAHDADRYCTVLKISPARLADLEHFGTPGSASYGQVLIRKQLLPAAVEASVEALRQSNPHLDLSESRRFLASPLDLRVACSSINVIHHEHLGMDICGGHDSSCELPSTAEPLIPSTDDSQPCARATAFARLDRKYCRPAVLSVAPAPESLVERFGTLHADRYLDVLLRLEHTPEFIAAVLASETKLNNPRVAELQQLLNRPRALRVICTAQDIIFSEWLQFA